MKRSLESAFPRLHVETTTNPKTAISCSASIPDIVLVDLNMPAENGIEVCMRMLALPANRRPIVVAMSSRAAPSDIAVLESLGVRHLVPKDDAFLASMSTIIATLRTQGTLAR